MCIVIWGSKGKIVKAHPEDILPRSCPQCRGDLVLCHLKKYFSLYYIPICATSTVDTFYECSNCKQTYKTQIKDILLSSAVFSGIKQPYGSSQATYQQSSSLPITDLQRDINEVKQELINLKSVKIDLDQEISMLRSQLIEKSLSADLRNENLLKWIKWFIRESKKFDANSLSNESYLQLLKSLENELIRASY